jgi:hypothetical protein
MDVRWIVSSGYLVSMLGLACAAPFRTGKDPRDLATTTLAGRECVNAEVAGLQQLSLLIFASAARS